MENIETVRDYLELDRDYASPVFESKQPIVNSQLKNYRVVEKDVNQNGILYLKVQPLRNKNSFWEGLKEVCILKDQHLDDLAVKS